MIRVGQAQRAHDPLPVLKRQVDTGVTSCDSWLSIVDVCTASTSDFESLPLSVEASCLCYSSSVWQPTVYDMAFETCLSYLSTASPSLYTSVGGDALPTDLCQSIGDVVAGTGPTTGTGTAESSTPGSPTTAQATISSPTPTKPPTSGACVSFNIILASCQFATTSFTMLPFSDEASCLCYTSGTYAPSVYDGYWSGCLDFYASTSPAFYSSIGGDELTRTPCASVGDVRTAAGGDTSSPGLITTEPPITTSSATPQSNPATLVTTVSVATTQGSGAPSTRSKWYTRTWSVTLGLFFLLL